MRELQPFAVITPEHVRIELIPAGMGRRCAAALFDLMLCLFMITAFGSLCRLLPSGLAILLSTTGAFLILWGYHVYCDVRYGGQSPGKRLMHLRVADARGLPVSLHQSMARNASRVLDMLPAGGVGLLACLLDPYRRRIGDRLADTLVISEHQSSSRGFRALERVPVNSLDVPRLRRVVAYHLSFEEREFMLSLCLRAHALQEHARYDLFETVGEYYRARFAIADEHLSNEKLVRNLLALCFRKE